MENNFQCPAGFRNKMVCEKIEGKLNLKVKGKIKLKDDDDIHYGM